MQGLRLKAEMINNIEYHGGRGWSDRAKSRKNILRGCTAVEKSANPCAALIAKRYIANEIEANGESGRWRSVKFTCHTTAKCIATSQGNLRHIVKGG